MRTNLRTPLVVLLMGAALTGGAAHAPVMRPIATVSDTIIISDPQLIWWCLSIAALLLLSIGPAIVQDLARRYERELITARLAREKRLEDLLEQQRIRVVQVTREGWERPGRRDPLGVIARIRGVHTAVKSQFGVLERRVEHAHADLRERTHRIHEELDGIGREVRFVRHGLSRGMVARSGLAAALDELRIAAEVPPDVKVDWKVLGLDVRLDPTLEVLIFRMVDDLVSNAFRRPHLGYVMVHVERKAGAVEVRVEDDGVDKEAARAERDLLDLASRIARMGGTVNSTGGEEGRRIVSMRCPLLE